MGSALLVLKGNFLEGPVLRARFCLSFLSRCLIRWQKNSGVLIKIVKRHGKGGVRLKPEEELSGCRPPNPGFQGIFALGTIGRGGVGRSGGLPALQAGEDPLRFPGPGPRSETVNPVSHGCSERESRCSFPLPRPVLGEESRGSGPDPRTVLDGGSRGFDPAAVAVTTSGRHTQSPPPFPSRPISALLPTAR